MSSLATPVLLNEIVTLSLPDKVTLSLVHDTEGGGTPSIWHSIAKLCPKPAPVGSRKLRIILGKAAVKKNKTVFSLVLIDYMITFYCISVHSDCVSIVYVLLKQQASYRSYFPLLKGTCM